MSARAFPAPRRGFTLVELMIGMLLGFIVLGGAIGVVLMVAQTYRANRALAQVQDGERVAFELLAHDIRSAQLTGCTNNARIANVVANNAATWWLNWNGVLTGYSGAAGQADPAVAFGTSTGSRVNGTDSLALLGAADTAMSVKSHTRTGDTGQFVLNGSTGNLQSGDVVVVCDPDHAALFRTSAVTAPTLTYDTTGNCTAALGYPAPANCVAGGSGNGVPYTFGLNAQIAPLAAVDWFVGVNPAGGTSLYRMALVNTGGVPTPTPQEMVRDVTALTLSYLSSGATRFVPADQVSQWADVSAVQVQLALQSALPGATTNGQPLTRTYTATVTLYNRVN